MTTQKRYFTQPRIFFLFCVLSFLYFWKPLLTGQPFYGEDFLWQFLPMNYVALQLIHSGQWPLWNPYMMSGMPLFASLSFPLFYPGTILFLIFSQHQATMLIYWFQIALAGYFTYKFSLLLQSPSESESAPESQPHLPAILSGIAFMFAGNVITLIYPGHTMKLIAATFIPIAMYGIARAFQSSSFRWFLITALVLSLQIFTLHFQVCYYTWILVGLYSLAKILKLVSQHFQATRLHHRTHSVVETYSPSSAGKYLVYLLAMGVLIVGLTAVQWLPFAEYTRWCTRSSGLDYKAATEASYPPEELLSLFMVSPFGDNIQPMGRSTGNVAFDSRDYPLNHFLYPAGLQYYHGRFDSARTLSEYLGALPFLLAAFGIALSKRRSTKFFILISILSVFLCLGKFNPLYPFLLKVIPGLDMFRVPAEILLLFSFSLAILAGIGLEEIMKLKFDFSAIYKRIHIFLIPIIIISILFFISKDNEEIIHFNLVFIRLNLLVFAGLFLLRYAALKNTRRYFALVPLLLFLDLWTAHQPYLQTMPIDGFYHAMRGEPGMEFLKQDPTDYRILPVGPHDMVNNKWLFSDIQSVWGYQSFPLRHYAEFWSTLGFTNPTLQKLTNVKYVVSSEPLTDPSLKLVYDTGKFIYKDVNYFPRYWLVDEKNCIVQKDEQKVLSTLTAGNFDPTQSVILDKSVETTYKHLLAEWPTSFFLSPHFTWSPQKIESQIIVDHPSFLVFSEIYYPGWKVFVDGKESQIYRADYILRAVRLPAGLHIIEMYYSPWTFWLGLWISTITLLLIIFLFIWSLKKKFAFSKF